MSTASSRLDGGERFISDRGRVFLAPVPKRTQHWPQLAALGGEQILGARRVLLVEAPLDEAGLLQGLEPGGQRIGADALKRQLEVDELARPFEQEIADDQDRPAVADDLEGAGYGAASVI